MEDEKPVQGQAAPQQQGLPAGEERDAPRSPQEVIPGTGDPDPHPPLKYTCEKCGEQTEGVRRRGPSHPRIPYCKVCFYPRQYRRCPDCNKAISARSKACKNCYTIGVLEARMVRLNKQLAVTQDRLARARMARE